MDKLNPVNEPVIFSSLVTVIGYVAARFALHLDAETVKAVAVILFAGGTWFGRTLSVPLARHKAVVNEVIQAANASKP